MNLSGFPLTVVDWSTVEAVTHPGETGVATWRTREFGGVRVRMVEYSPGYLADHWCVKGHVVLCVAGAFETETPDGEVQRLTAGMSYQVADNAEPHRSRTAAGGQGATLFIVD
ncbi:MAG: DHCW motif cupin fold protein [Phycisphaeraceae bacterium]|nr:DHCW motif cupin fold protein [Phycisphaeraceae bacterium]